MNHSRDAKYMAAVRNELLPGIWDIKGAVSLAVNEPNRTIDLVLNDGRQLPLITFDEVDSKLYKSVFRPRLIEGFGLKDA